MYIVCHTFPLPGLLTSSSMILVQYVCSTNVFLPELCDSSIFVDKRPLTQPLSIMSRLTFHESQKLIPFFSSPMLENSFKFVLFALFCLYRLRSWLHRPCYFSWLFLMWYCMANMDNRMNLDMIREFKLQSVLSNNLEDYEGPESSGT